MSEILEKIDKWREEAWDGTLLSHMDWCIRGAELHKKLSEYLSWFKEKNE